MPAVVNSRLWDVRLAAVALGCTLLLSSCTLGDSNGSPSHTDTSVSQTSETITSAERLERREHLPGFPTVTGVNTASMPGIGFTYKVSEMPRYYTRTVVFPESLSQLNEDLSRIVDERIAEFVATTSAPESTTDYMVNKSLPAVLPQLHISSEVSAISSESIAVRLTFATAPEDTSVRRYLTLWFDVQKNRQLEYADLFIDEDAWNTIQSLIQDRLDAHPGITKDLTADRAWIDFFDSLNFLDDGTAVIEFDYDSVSSTSEDLFEISVPADQVTGLLSKHGLAAQRAAMNPVVPPLLADAPASPLPPASTTATGSSELLDGPLTTATPDCAEIKCVALTFDDGPSAYTESLLDVLQSRNAPATFFVIGSNISQRPDTLHRMVFEGHQVGSHSWNHSQLTSLTPESIKQNLARTSTLIRNITGTPPVITRPPFGATDKSTGLLLTTPSILWSLDSEDWLLDSPEQVAEHVGENVSAGDIVLLHDISPDTPATVELILDQLEEQELVPVTVSQLLADRKTEAGVNYYHGKTSTRD